MARFEPGATPEPAVRGRRAGFLNVDLEIRSAAELSPLIDALGREVYVLHTAREKRTYVAFIELSRWRSDADATVRAFCTLISKLPARVRRLWTGCRSRDFNIGIQAQHEPLAAEFALKAETVQAVAKLGGRIVVTVYAPEPRDFGT